jgi:hypothetical protein
MRIKMGTRVNYPNQASGEAQDIGVWTNRQTWRGHPILSEEELSDLDFPYPPEPDFEEPR